MRFSERYGCLKPSDVIIRESLTSEIENAICTCYDKLNYSFGHYEDLEEHLWINFLFQRMGDFYNLSGGHKIVAVTFIQDKNVEWYRKLDLIEETLNFLFEKEQYAFIAQFVEELNDYFEKLNFGYRIVGGLVTEITSKQEIKSIETAINDSEDNVSMHLNKALQHYAHRPNPDYRNSIKEAISAVEAQNRNITGENTLNFNKLEEKGLKIPSVLRDAFLKLYGYTNDKSTGIRHSLMDDTPEYVPGAEEALYMLITCSAFINYLNSKLK